MMSLDPHYNVLGGLVQKGSDLIKAFFASLLYVKLLR